MRPGAVRARIRPDIRGRRTDAQSVGGELVLDAKRQRERVAGLRVQVVLDDHAVLLPLRLAPRRPANQPVDRRLRAELVERQLVDAASELVASCRDPVRPRDEHLAAARRAHLAGVVAVQDFAIADRVRAKTAADLGDDDPLLLERDLELLAGCVVHAHGTTVFSARIAIDPPFRPG